jgi:hypothetical protein
LIKKEVPCETDQLTHVYTLIIWPDAAYSTLIMPRSNLAASTMIGIFFLQRKSKTLKARR